MPTVKLSTDSMQTWFAVGQAVLSSVIGYLASLKDGELQWDSPFFWLGISYAALTGVKGYFAAGVKAEVKPATPGEPVQKVDVVVPAEVKP